MIPGKLQLLFQALMVEEKVRKTGVGEYDMSHSWHLSNLIFSNWSSTIRGVGHISGGKMNYLVSELWGRQQLNHDIKIAFQPP